MSIEDSFTQVNERKTVLISNLPMESGVLPGYNVAVLITISSNNLIFHVIVVPLKPGFSRFSVIGVNGI